MDEAYVPRDLPAFAFRLLLGSDFLNSGYFPTCQLFAANLLVKKFAKLRENKTCFAETLSQRKKQQKDEWRCLNF